MKNFIVLPIFLFAFNAFSQKQDSHWKLVWSDEFNYIGRPDSKKWDYELGNRRNNEQQCYTNKPENVFVKNGFLNIVALKQKTPNPDFIPTGNLWWQKAPSYDYSSGDITTNGKFSFQYGKIEVRAKVPSGNGTWPAIWMLGVDKEHLRWPRQGEIDIMEHYGFRPEYVYGTLHYGDALEGKHQTKGLHYISPKPISDDFHVFSAVWTPHSIEIYVDSILFHRLDLDSASVPFKQLNKDSKEWNSDIVYRKQPFYIILNLAMKGVEGVPIDDKSLPATFLIDYVRVYQKTDIATSNQ